MPAPKFKIDDVINFTYQQWNVKDYILVIKGIENLDYLVIPFNESNKYPIVTIPVVIINNNATLSLKTILNNL